MTEKNNIATVNAKSLGISTKISVEMCNAIRNQPIAKARRLLQDIIDMKRPLKLTRFVGDRGHKPGKLAAGRYPIDLSIIFLKLMRSLEANAETKGLY